MSFFHLPSLLAVLPAPPPAAAAIHIVRRREGRHVVRKARQRALCETMVHWGGGFVSVTLPGRADGCFLEAGMKAGQQCRAATTQCRQAPPATDFKEASRENLVSQGNPKQPKLNAHACEVCMAERRSSRDALLGVEGEQPVEQVNARVAQAGELLQ